MFGVDFVDLFSLVFLNYKSPFNICCKAGFEVLNSLNSCLSKKLFISPSILNEILDRYSNPGCRFFPLSTLNISSYTLLACRASSERSVVKHMGFPLYVTCCFSLAAFNILCVYSLLVWLYVSWPVSLWVYPLWDSLWLLDLTDYFLFYVGEIFNYNLFKKFSHILSFSLLLGPL